MNKKCFRNICAPHGAKFRSIFSVEAKPIEQVTKGLKYMKWTTRWDKKSSLTLTFEHVTCKLIWIIYLLGATPAPSLVLIKWRGQKVLTVWFDLDLWTCDLQINRDHNLIEGNPCTKYGIDQVKGSKDIDRTTHRLRRVVWPWPFNMWPENQ